MTSLPFTVQTSLGKGSKTFVQHVRLKFDPLGNDIVELSGSRTGGLGTVEERKGGEGRKGMGGEGRGRGGEGKGGEWSRVTCKRCDR